jgi:hypothetical protein
MNPFWTCNIKQLHIPWSKIIQFKMESLLKMAILRLSIRPLSIFAIFRPTIFKFWTLIENYTRINDTFGYLIYYKIWNRARIRTLPNKDLLNYISSLLEDLFFRYFSAPSISSRLAKSNSTPSSLKSTQGVGYSDSEPLFKCSSKCSFHLASTWPAHSHLWFERSSNVIQALVKFRRVLNTPMSLNLDWSLFVELPCLFSVQTSLFCPG